jgi:hypothetical protein
MKYKPLFDLSFRRQLFVDPPEPTPDPGVPPTPEPPPATPQPSVEDLQKQLNDLKTSVQEKDAALGKLQEWYTQIAPQVQANPDGTFSLKKDPEELTAEQRNIQDTAARTALDIHRLSESSDVAKSKVFNEMRVKDPLFEKTSARAQEIMLGVNLSQRNETAWNRAFNLARGEYLSEYEAIHRKTEAEKTKSELMKSSAASIIVSGNPSSDDTEMKEAVKSFKWTERLAKAADQQIRAGMLSSREQYAELYIKNELTNGGA